MQKEYPFLQFFRAVIALEEGRIEPRLSYVTGFEPWGWLPGTEIYIDDVERTIFTVISRIILISLVFRMLSLAMVFGSMAKWVP
jgi:signal transduction histidine kinase